MSYRQAMIAAKATYKKSGKAAAEEPEAEAPKKKRGKKKKPEDIEKILANIKSRSV